MHRMTAHAAAVKALAWCPFQSNLLASGGGTADRCIKFWNTHTGALLNSIDTGSQVQHLPTCHSITLHAHDMHGKRQQRRLNTCPGRLHICLTIHSYACA